MGGLRAPGTRPHGQWSLHMQILASKTHKWRDALGLALGLCMVFPPAASSQTLDQALSAAFAGNPGLDAERARQRADQETIRQEWAKTLPNVSLDAHRGTEETKTQPAGTDTELDQDGYSLSLSQPLFRGFQTVNGIRRAKAEVNAGASKLHDREQNVLLDTVTAYMDVVRDRKIVRFRQDNVVALRNEMHATKARRRAGDLSRTDVAQARARLYEGQADLAQARADVEASEAAYEALVGQRPGNLTPPPLPAALIPHTLEDALRIARSLNPTIVGAIHSQEAARRAKNEAYGALLPTVSLDLSHGVDHNTSTTIDREEESSVFVRMKMPLFQGGDSYSRIRQTKARETGASHEVTDSRRRTRASVIDSWKQHHAAKSRITAARQQVTAAREALKGVRIEVKVGERALFEVLDAQRELVNAEVALARAERDHVVTSYQLVAATGRLTARSLRLPVVYPSLDKAIKRKNPRTIYRKHPAPANRRQSRRVPARTTGHARHAGRVNSVRTPRTSIVATAPQKSSQPQSPQPPSMWTTVATPPASKRPVAVQSARKRPASRQRVNTRSVRYRPVSRRTLSRSAAMRAHAQQLRQANAARAANPLARLRSSFAED